MSTLVIIFLGLLIGFLAAVPIGPLNIYAITQALKHDFLRGFLPGLTASFLDVIYCFTAFKGIFHLSSILSKFAPILKIIGAVLLTTISVRLIKQSKTFDGIRFTRNTSVTYSRSIFIAFFLYVSNPNLYVFWLAVAGIVTAHQWVTHVGGLPVVFALSCGSGSVIWYFVLAKYVSKYHQQFKLKTFRRALIVLALVLIVFALYSLATLFY
jgi:L-lysine exporter family protein LysE/ArgO